MVVSFIHWVTMSPIYLLIITTYVDNQISWNNIGGTGQNTIDDAIKHVNNQAINANQGWNVVTDSGAASQKH